MSTSLSTSRSLLFSLMPIALSIAWLVTSAPALAVAVQVFAWFIVVIVGLAVLFANQLKLDDAPARPRLLGVLSTLASLVVIAALYRMQAMLVMVLYTVSFVAVFFGISRRKATPDQAG